MKVPRVPVRRLEARAALAEMDLPREAARDHPLQRSVHGGAADPRILAMHEVGELLGADVAFLPQEDAEDAIAFARAFAAGRKKRREIGRGVYQFDGFLIH